MIKGRLNKELKEICLLDQVYVKAEDGKQSVAQVSWIRYAKEIGANTFHQEVRSFRDRRGSGEERGELRRGSCKTDGICNFINRKVLKALENPVKRVFSRVFLRSGANP